MGAKRIIPCLDVNKGRVVKGVKFVDLQDVGDPVEAAKAYEQAGADELVFLDITATHEGRGTVIDMVRKVADAITIPFAVGGGIKSVEDFGAVLNAGADKASLGSAAVRNPELINQVAEKFGSNRLIAAIDGKRTDSARMGSAGSADPNDGLHIISKYNVVIDGGRTDSGVDAIEWAKEAEERGVGEILLTSLDCDGMKTGYDLELTKAISAAVNVPVTASGGAGTLEHFYEAITIGGAEAVLAASLFHFKEIEIIELKKYLQSKGIEVSL